ncbi:MAG: hypothetical protein KF849_01160 [Rhizobiaceae bacterium]|nr:hypothetical protein [Rhizobiaceae bacterium]
MVARIFLITLFVSPDFPGFPDFPFPTGREWTHCPAGIPALIGAFKPYSQIHRKEGMRGRMRHFCARCAAPENDVSPQRADAIAMPRRRGGRISGQIPAQSREMGYETCALQRFRLLRGKARLPRIDGIQGWRNAP